MKDRLEGVNLLHEPENDEKLEDLLDLKKIVALPVGQAPNCGNEGSKHDDDVINVPSVEKELQNKRIRKPIMKTCKTRELTPLPPMAISFRRSSNT